MKGMKNEKYTKIFLCALAVLFVSMLFLGFVLNFSFFKGIILAFASACKPVVYAVLIVFFVNGIISFYAKLFARLFVKFKKRDTLCKVFSVVLGYITFIAVIAAMLIIVIVPSVSSCAKLIEKIPEYIVGAKAWIEETVKNIPILAGESEKILEYINGSFSFSYDSITEYAPMVMGAANKILSEASNLLIGFIISIYITVSSEYINRVKNRLVHAFLSEEKSKQVHDYIFSIYGFFAKYFSGRALYAIIMWIVFYILMWALGIEFYSVISLIIAVLTMIPVVGTVIAFSLSIFFVLITSFNTVIPFAIITFVLMILAKTLLQKRIMHKSVRTSLTASLVSVLVMYGLFGTVGALVAVPVYLSIKLVIKGMISAREEKQSIKLKKEASESGIKEE